MQTLPLAAQIAAVAKRQHGVVTRAQLVELGLTLRQVEGWYRSGRVDRLLPSVFRLAGAPSTREQALMAAVLWAGPGAFASHRSAAELWGFDGVKAARPEVTVPLAKIKKSTEVLVHQTRAAIVGRTRRGIPVTTPERTLIDLSASSSSVQIEVAFESARRERLVTTASVCRNLESAGMRGRHGTSTLNQLVTVLATEPPCESALEVMTARVLRESDLPKPQRQVEIIAGGSTYRLDFAWPAERIALECDGRKWHEIDFERDRERWSAIAAQTGYRFVWATWRSINDEPERIVAELRQLRRG